MTRQSVARGILAFFVILLMMPLGHAFVVLMERHLDGFGLKLSAGLLGFSGICLAICGNRFRGEAMRTLAGVTGAILFWGSWVEFCFICFGHSLDVAPLMSNGMVYTKPEYRLMPVTIPFSVLAFIMYLYWASTRWGVILYLRRILKIGETERPKIKNESINAFIDLLLLIWWAYLILLVEYDPDILGAHHPVTLCSAALCLVVAIILFVRSLRSPTWASALRQAIVTVCVLWTFVEVMIKLKLFTEVWIYPEKYIAEMIAIVIAFAVSIYIMAKMGHKNVKMKKRHE